jgi:hypothetical protein
MRDNIWLNQRLNQIWELLFPELTRPNTVFAKFKGKWKNKFGHIKLMKDKSTEIAVNRIFQKDIIPEFIIDLTLAHELTHYMHGFHSPHPRQHRHPHAGGVVTKELKKRGFEHLIIKEKLWVKNSWWKIVEVEFGPQKKKSFLERLLN